MALITTIRDNKFLLVGLLGLGLLAFILMDVMSGGPSNVPTDFTLGKVNGEAIDMKEFNQVERTLYSGANVDQFQVKDFLWNYFLEKEMIEGEAEALGLSISRDELMDLQFGQNLSPVITQRFANAQTGQVDREQLNSLRQQIESGTLREEAKPFWREQEKEIKKVALQGKLNTMVSNAVYTPNWILDELKSFSSKNVDLAYVKVPFAEIGDEELELTDDDFNAYIDSHREELRQDKETRIGSYTIFDVIPSVEDSLFAKNAIADKKESFLNAANDSTYAQRNRGLFNKSYQTKTDLAEVNFPDELYSLPVGELLGPTLINNAYTMFKVTGRKVVPDSVEARHILISVDAQNPQGITIARNRIDSIKNVIESGAGDFETMASQYGMDGTRSNGGSLGTFGRGAMVKEFNDLVFYEAETDELNVVKSQFGIHLVEVTRKVFDTNEEGIQFAFIREPVIASSKTINAVEDKVIELINNSPDKAQFEAAVEANPDLELNKTKALMDSDYQIEGITKNSTARNMVKWLFQSDNTDEVSPNFFSIMHPTLQYTTNYIILARDRVIPKGLPGVDALKPIIEDEVYKLKKGGMLAERLSSASSLTAIASDYSVDVDTLQNIGFSSTSIPEIGEEPKLLGKIFNAQENVVSEPIAGNNGVYKFVVLSATEMQSQDNRSAMRSRISNKTASQTQIQLLKSLIDKSEIEDNRNQFF